MTQREAVYLAVCAVLGEEVNYKVELSKSQIKEVEQHVYQLFTTGQVELRNAENRSAEWLKKYVPGLVNNWLRKDTRLNGGEKYTIKNPGSRVGAGDPTLKALKALLSVTTDPTHRRQVEDAIKEREALLKPKKEISIEIELLPEGLRHLVDPTKVKVVEATPPMVRRASDD